MEAGGARNSWLTIAKELAPQPRDVLERAPGPARRGLDERPADGRCRERSDCAHGFQIGQRLRGGRTEPKCPRAAALPRVHDKRLRRPARVLGPVAQ